MSRKRVLLDLVIVSLLSLSIVWVFQNRQAVIDHVIAWEFKPSSAVADLATQSGMGDNGRFLYYASQPAIEERADFNKSCPNDEKQAAILGCYVGSQIYVYDVTDTRISNVKTVTAAHEMLHAAYARLSDSDKKYVNGLIEAEYQRIKDRPDIASAMVVYAKSEPGEADNELHSIIGTEVGGLSPELENYYGRYFSSRSEVVSAYQSYESVFTNLQSQADQIQSQLTSLKTQIENATSTYTADSAQLSADISAFNVRARERGGFSSQAEFDSTRSALESRVEALNAQQATINQMIAQYNALVVQLNALATESQSLDQSINSNLPATPQL